MRPSASSYTVAIGFTGEPTAPGRRSGGKVRRKRERLWARSRADAGFSVRSRENLEFATESTEGVEKTEERTLRRSLLSVCSVAIGY